MASHKVHKHRRVIQTSQKRWFGKVCLTLHCDVMNGARPVAINTAIHWNTPKCDEKYLFHQLFDAVKRAGDIFVNPNYVLPWSEKSIATVQRSGFHLFSTTPPQSNWPELQALLTLNIQIGRNTFRFKNVPRTRSPLKIYWPFLGRRGSQVITTALQQFQF